MTGLLWIAVLPVIVLLGYIYKKDIDKEPRGLLIRLFIFGGVSVIPIAFAELAIADYVPGLYLPTFLGTFLTTFVSVGVIEELGKWIFAYLCTYRRREYNHSYDGIVYCVFVSLGFACVENILYVFQHGFGTGILRAVLAVPGHAVDAVFMGYFLSKSKEFLVKRDGTNTLVNLFLSIMVPSIVHTIYDGLLFHSLSSNDTMYIIIFLIFVIVSYIISIAIVKSQSKILFNFDGSGATSQPFVPAPPRGQMQAPLTQYQPAVPMGSAPVAAMPTQTVVPTVQPVVQQPVQPQTLPHSFCYRCGSIFDGNKCSNCGFEINK